MMKVDLLNLENCRVCPRNCGINRYSAKGYCQSNYRIRINTCQLHYGEEPIISGYNGSGTVFFSHCNLKCVYCQNYRISQYGWGQDYTQDEVIEKILKLQEMGAHNINFVSPTHYSAQLYEILSKIKKNDLKIPVIWNSNGYEKDEMVRLLKGLVDVYLVDLKYCESEISLRYSDAIDYSEYAYKAIKEMYSQTGEVELDSDGLVKKGLIIRMLLLPEDLNSTEASLLWIKNNLGLEVYISLMAQYYPVYKAKDYPQINRGIIGSEYEHSVKVLMNLGFENGFVQEVFGNSEWIPKFKNSEHDKKKI